MTRRTYGVLYRSTRVCPTSNFVPVPPENVIRALITCTYGFPYNCSIASYPAKVGSIEWPQMRYAGRAEDRPDWSRDMVEGYLEKSMIWVGFTLKNGS